MSSGAWWFSLVFHWAAYLFVYLFCNEPCGLQRGLSAGWARAAEHGGSCLPCGAAACATARAERGDKGSISTGRGPAGFTNFAFARENKSWACSTGPSLSVTPADTCRCTRGGSAGEQGVVEKNPSAWTPE